MADDPAELTLGDKEPGADPTLDLVAWPPAFDVAANGLDDREGRLDHVGAAQSAAKLIWNTQLVNRECFLQAFFEAASCARVQLHQLTMQLVESALGLRII